METFSSSAISRSLLAPGVVCVANHWETACGDTFRRRASSAGNIPAASSAYLIVRAITGSPIRGAQVVQLAPLPLPLFTLLFSGHVDPFDR